MTMEPLRLIAAILAAIALIMALELGLIDDFAIGMGAMLLGAGGLGWIVARRAYGALSREKAIEDGLWFISFVCAGFAFMVHFELGVLGAMAFTVAAVVYSGRRYRERSGIEAGRRVVRRFYEEVVSTGDVDRVASFIHEDCVEVDGDVRVERGVEGMIEHVRGVRSVYPDLVITVERQITEGDWVVSVITARGTHAGEWLGMKPTGERLEFTGVNVDRVVDGKIIEHGGTANMLIPFLESGALVPADS